MTAPAAAEFWHVDVRIKGEWKSTPHSMPSLREAQNRADAVFHWATARVRNIVTRETWSREPGRGWSRQPTEPLTPPPAAPRKPLRSPEHATVEEPNYWWRKE